jgi:hypothetical protein
MNKKADAAPAATSVRALSGPYRWSVQNLRKTSRETRGANVSTYSLFMSIPGFWIRSYLHFLEKNGPPLPVYICGADNSSFRGKREVMGYEKK